MPVCEKSAHTYVMHTCACIHMNEYVHTCIYSFGSYCMDKCIPDFPSYRTFEPEVFCYLPSFATKEKRGFNLDLLPLNF